MKMTDSKLITRIKWINAHIVKNTTALLNDEISLVEFKKQQRKALNGLAELREEFGLKRVVDLEDKIFNEG